MHKRQIEKCVAKRKNTKAAGADQMVNGFMKYGGEGMLPMIVRLYNKRYGKKEYAPRSSKQGGVVNLSKKRDKAYPGDYRLQRAWACFGRYKLDFFDRPGVRLRLKV